MTMNIDPSQSPITTGMPAQKKKAPGSPAAAGSSKGTQVFQMAENVMDPSKAGVVMQDADDRGIAGVLNLDGPKKLFNGDPQLLNLLDAYHENLTGERKFEGAGMGARFAEIGIYARRCPPPVLFDAEDLTDLLGTTMCIDTVGRVFVYAPFFEFLLREEEKRLLAVTPVLVHEYKHSLFEHNFRMRNFPPIVANIAQDRVINPMTVLLWGNNSAAKFSPFFLNAYGLRKEDERFKGLADETIGKMMMAEAAEKGTIKIGKLTIVDGKVGNVTTHSAAHGDTLDLGDITVTVEDLGMQDKLDTIFDCGTMIVDEIDNQLKPRNRPMPPSGKSGGGRDAPIKIPVFNPNNIAEGLGEAMDPSSGHMIDDKTLAEGLKERGYDQAVEDYKIGKTPAEAMEVIREGAMMEGAKERSRIGSRYPGAHIADYYGEVVKPARKYDITWDRKVREFISGSGPIMARSIDEPSILNYIDAEEMGMREEDRVYLSGMIPQKPEDIYVFMNDTSGSVSNDRLGKFLSLGISMRQSADDLAPSIMIIGADTVMRGTPQDLDDDTILDIIENGYNFAGRGGTDVIAPLNQLMKWAREEQIKIAGIVYATDLGISPINPEHLPHDLPPLMFVAMPDDFAGAQHFVESAREVADVVVIEPEMELNLDLAEQRAANRGNGIKLG